MLDVSGATALIYRTGAVLVLAMICGLIAAYIFRSKPSKQRVALMNLTFTGVVVVGALVYVL